MSNYPRPGVFITESLLPATRIQRAAAANAAGAAVGALPKGPTSVTLCTSWYDFTSIYGGLNTAYPSTYSIRSFFQNGGRDLYVLRLLGDDAVAASAAVPRDGGVEAVLTFTALNKGDEGNDLKVTVSAGSTASTWDIAISQVVDGVSGDVPREFYPDLVLTADDPANIATVINNDSVLVSVVINDLLHNPDPGTYTMTLGANGTDIGKDNYVSETGSPAFDALTIAARPLVLFLPSLHTDITGETASSDRQEVYAAAVSWAEANYGFVVVDTPNGLTSAQAVTYKTEVTPSSHAAEYWPNLVVADPLGRSRRALRKIGCSGAVAGIFLSTDATRGVFKAPAGLEASLAGVASLEVAHKPSDLNALYAGGVNAIRQVPGSGVVVMGARTLKADRTADQHVSIRRALMYLEKSLYDLTEFAVFENNNDTLWARLSTVLTVFLNNFWTQGGLAGSTQQDAFFVKCDAENNTLASIQAGEVNIEVGVAVQYPAEFVVIRLSQQAGV